MIVLGDHAKCLYNTSRGATILHNHGPVECQDGAGNPATCVRCKVEAEAAKFHHYRKGCTWDIE